MMMTTFHGLLINIVSFLARGTRDDTYDYKNARKVKKGVIGTYVEGKLKGL